MTCFPDFFDMCPRKKIMFPNFDIIPKNKHINNFNFEWTAL